MNDIQTIQNKIYEIRGQKVMLDFDIAEMYGVETRVLNQAVKRNLKRFPEDFMFQLTSYESEIMSSQIVMTSKSKRPKSALPYAFTEHGVVMLSSVLRSDTAIQVSIAVSRAFVTMRRMLSQQPKRDELSELQSDVRKLKEYIEEVLTDQNDINDDTTMRLELIEQSLAELQVKTKSTDRNPIGFRP